MEQIQLTKEEFKKLRAEAGFETNSEFMRKLGYYSSCNVNNWFVGRCDYPRYLKYAFFLFKLNLNFDAKKYEKFVLELKNQAKGKAKTKTERLTKEEKTIIKNSKIALKDLNYEELEKNNLDLKKEYEILSNLLLENKSKIKLNLKG